MKSESHLKQLGNIAMNIYKCPLDVRLDAEQGKEMCATMCVKQVLLPTSVKSHAANWRELAQAQFYEPLKEQHVAIDNRLARALLSEHVRS
jgi:hypothetical protein